jgi:outer membrane protein assembly factor BamB
MFSFLRILVFGRVSGRTVFARTALPVAVLAVAPYLAAGAASGPLTANPAQWTVELGGGATSGPVRIGTPEATEAIAVALASGKIALFDAHGQKMREMSLDLAPGAAPVGAGGRLYAADTWGALYCFNLQGERLWKYSREDRFGSGYSYLVAADLDGDNQPEVIVAGQRGWLYAIDGRGRLRFELKVTGFRLSAPSVGDINGDGVPEIVFGDDDGEVYCVSARGAVLWSARQGDARFGRSLPLVADADGDGRYEVYMPVATGGDGPGVYAYNGLNGKLLWRAASQMQSYNSTIIADVDGDGRNEVLFGDKNTRLYAFDSAGRALWDRQLDGTGVFFAGVVADLEGAGHATIFQQARGPGLTGKSLYAVDSAGRIVDSMPLAGGGGHSPVLCRFGGERDLKLVVISAAGKMICIRPPQKEGAARILWGGTRGNGAFTGFLPSPRAAAARSAAPRPVDGANAIHHLALEGRNLLGVAPPPENAIAAVRVTDPDGAVHLTIMRPGDALTGSFAAPKTGQYRTAVMWIDRASGRVLRDERAIYTLDPARTEDIHAQADFRREVAGLREKLGRHDELAEYFLSLARGFGPARREERPYQVALLREAARRRPAGTLMVRQLANPWPDLDAVAALEAATPVPGAVSVSLLGNEYESAALALSNLAPREATVRIQTEAFVAASSAGAGAKPSTAAYQVLEVRDTPLIRRTATGKVSEDPLPLAGEGNTFRLGPGETRKVWLTFRSTGLAAGRYTSRLVIGDLLALDPPLEVPVTVDVDTVRLPEKHSYYHNNWLYLASIQDPVILENTIADATSHGTNVFCIPPVSFKVDEAGALGAMNGVAHDRIVERLRGRAFFLITGTVGLEWPAGAKPSDELRERALADGIRRYGEHMTGMGVDFKEWAFYVKDEPGLMGQDAAYDQWMADMRRLKAIDRRIQLYADPAGGARPEMLKQVEDVVTVWQPALDLYRDYPEGLSAIFRKGLYWHYEAPGEQRELDPLGYYRAKPWVAYGAGMTGGGYWVYSFSPYWFFERSLTTEYGSVYLTEKGPVTTKRWEASRDGAEDFELIAQLERTARAAGEGGRDALALIAEAVAFVTKGQEQATDISRKLHSYTPDFAAWMQYRARLIEAQRRLDAKGVR